MVVIVMLMSALCNSATQLTFSRRVHRDMNTKTRVHRDYSIIHCHQQYNEWLFAFHFTVKQTFQQTLFSVNLSYGSLTAERAFNAVTDACISELVSVGLTIRNCLQPNGN